MVPVQFFFFRLFCFPPKTPVFLLIQYLCNARRAVLECVRVGSITRTHRATNGVNQAEKVL